MSQQLQQQEEIYGFWCWQTNPHGINTMKMRIIHKKNVNESFVWRHASIHDRQSNLWHSGLQPILSQWVRHNIPHNKPYILIAEHITMVNLISRTFSFSLQHRCIHCILWAVKQACCPRLQTKVCSSLIITKVIHDKKKHIQINRLQNTSLSE